MKVVWCLKSMEHFGRIVANALGWTLFVEAPVLDADVVYIIGMYDPPNYNYTLDMTKGARKRIIHWCGSDVYGLTRLDLLPEATHIAESPWLGDALRMKGLQAVHIGFPTPFIPEVTPLPKENTVAVYMGSNPARYGESTVRAIAEMMPDVQFRAYTYGTYPLDQMPRVIADTKVCLRLVYPDGSATSAREFMCAGRRAITAVPVEYATVVVPDDLPGIVSALRVALRHTEPDYDAAAFHQEYNRPERFAAEVEGLL
jgi:hypothetical protein